MIIFMGLAGSGKSTQAGRLAKRLGCARVATGDILRAHATADEAQRMLSGEILPDEELLPLLEVEINKLKGQQFILDGSPRTLDQAKWLISKDQAGELNITDVIHLRISRPAATIRLLARGRPDDVPEAISERFKEYDEAILPVLEYLRSQGIQIHEIDGEHATTTVAGDVEKALGLEPTHIA